MPTINFNFTDTLAHRIANCITGDIEKLALDVCQVRVNWQTRFETPRKAHFAQWLVATYPQHRAAIETALPPLEQRAESYRNRATSGKPMTIFNNVGTPEGQAQASQYQDAYHPAAATPTVRRDRPMPDAEPDAEPQAKPATKHVAPQAKPATKHVAPQANNPVGNDALAQVLRDALGVGDIDHDTIREIVREELRGVDRPQRIVVQVADESRPAVDLGVQHKTFPRLLTYCQQRDYKGFVFPVLIPGPTGSGKTTAAQSVATALGLPFYYTGAVDTEYKMLGFKNALGEFVETAFYKVFKYGGVFLVDEIDGGNPFAYVAMQAALENGFCIFGDEMVTRHPDCIIIAAGNTYGTGATHEYVGRNKLDAATLDRFITLTWDYDEAFERTLAGNDYWVSKVQTIRRAVHDCGIKHVVSPRASIRGAVLLKDGVPESEVLQSVVFKGLSAEQVRQVQARC